MLGWLAVPGESAVPVRRRAFRNFKRRLDVFRFDNSACDWDNKEMLGLDA